MLNQTLEQGQALTDAALERLLPAATQRPASIHQAMRHSVFAGGKRLRPILCMEAGHMVSGSLPSGIEELGAALEMLHTYSLIHDDLPALDNDAELKAKGLTVLLVEQNVSDALTMSDRGYVLSQGSVVRSGRGKELLNDPEVQQAYLGL